MNKKLIYALLLAVMAAAFISIPACAYDTPTQGTDNATDVIIWHGDSADVTISGLEDAVTDTGTKLLTVLLLFGVTAFGYWHRDIWILGLAGFGWILYGFSFWSTSWYLSIILVGFGAYLIVKAMWDRRKAAS